MTLESLIAAMSAERSGRGTIVDRDGRRQYIDLRVSPEIYKAARKVAKRSTK